MELNSSIIPAAIIIFLLLVLVLVMLVIIYKKLMSLSGISVKPIDYDDTDIKYINEASKNTNAAQLDTLEEEEDDEENNDSQTEESN